MEATALVSTKTSWFPQYFAAISGTLCVFCGGTAIAWTSPAIPMLTSGAMGEPLTEEEASWVSSLLAAGALLGSLPAGPVADIIGRKVGLLSQGLLFFLSWLMIYLAKSTRVLYLSRFLAGIAVGASTSISPLYTSEIAEENLKGPLCSLTQLMIVSGVLYAYTLGAFCSYQMLALLCGAGPLVFISLFLAAPESPVYQMARGLEKEAERSLLALRGSVSNVAHELSTMKRLAAPHCEGSVWRWRRSSIKAAGICLALMVFQQLSGVNFIVFNSTEVFSEVGGMYPALSTIALGGVQVLATLAATLLVPVVERRALLTVSSFLMAAALLSTGVYLNLRPLPLPWIPLVLLLAYMVAFSLGFGPVPFVLLGELLAPEVKPLVSGLSIGINWVAAFAVVKSYPALLSAIGADRVFWLYGIFCLLITLFVVAFVVETKDKDVETVQEELETGCPSGYQRI